MSSWQKRQHKHTVKYDNGIVNVRNEIKVAFIMLVDPNMIRFKSSHTECPNHTEYFISVEDVRCFSFEREKKTLTTEKEQENNFMSI